MGGGCRMLQKVKSLVDEYKIEFLRCDEWATNKEFVDVDRFFNGKNK